MNQVDISATTSGTYTDKMLFAINKERAACCDLVVCTTADSKLKA